MFRSGYGRTGPIMTLARNMIHLAGLVEGQDIDIAVTGLRPGKNCSRKFDWMEENIFPTYHEKIRRFRGEGSSSELLVEWLENLRILLAAGNPDCVKLIWRDWFPNIKVVFREVAELRLDDFKAVAQLS